MGIPFLTDQDSMEIHRGLNITHMVWWPNMLEKRWDMVLSVGFGYNEMLVRRMDDFDMFFWL